MHRHRHAERSCPCARDGGYGRRGTEDRPWPNATGPWSRRHQPCHQTCHRKTLLLSLYEGGLRKGGWVALVVRLEDGMRDGKREKRRGEPGRGCRIWQRVISSFGGRDAQAVVASLQPALRKAAPAAKPARCWESPVRDATGAAPAPAICTCTDATERGVLQCEILGRCCRTLNFSKIGHLTLSLLNPVASVEHWSARMPSCAADPCPEYSVEIPHSCN